ncbi:type II toxin-antitoxin system VapB family antitoxin [Phenylobacterium aquaticum]|uniref:type II toxin-antitoxin system VapB family antitoxin n=1 Tax=Phenylobacterium aquaticum TaxID=1763816 RepID=UPI001F5C3990|nr:type II toxin-antitoxin system VapB family antitoxin [Phenylobacterium aquaticum]MCI3132347.1 type II toxin-antitoxin system VapB family antitoxin [Phenylobacterium aquaticum]
MRLTITVDDALLARARDLVGEEDDARLIRDALTALVQRESARRLAGLGGSDPNASAAPRRRPARQQEI